MTMQFISTHGDAPAVGIEAALAAGLAPDGGLYVGASIPPWTGDVAALAALPLPEVAQSILAPWFVGSTLADALPELCAEAFNFPAPLVAMKSESDFLLELFHGPTAAFKDYAARFLAGSLARLRTPGQPETTVIVATSGDTGAAVASAFHRKSGFHVVILYPAGRVSPRQAHGLECWGDNVRALRVAGSFDDCQQLAKQALNDADLRTRLSLATANSISLGRLLPQMAYYAQAASAHFAAHRQPLNFIIPSGNLGNASAAFLARMMDLPVGEIRLACNANDVLPRYFHGGDYRPQAARATPANAMDVGAPSNFERLRHWALSDAELRLMFAAESVDDDTIRNTIATAPERHGIVPCPHTACGLRLLEDLRTSGDTRPWAVAATAHPAKFESTVEPLVGHVVEPPPALAEALARPASGQRLANDYRALCNALQSST